MCSSKRIKKVRTFKNLPYCLGMGWDVFSFDGQKNESRISRQRHPVPLLEKLGEALLDDVDALLQLSLRDDQRRREPDGVSVRRFGQQAVLGHLKLHVHHNVISNHTRLESECAK